MILASDRPLARDRCRVRRPGLRGCVGLLGLLLSVGGAAGCAGKDREVEAPEVQVPERIDDVDAFERAINDFALLSLQDPARGPLRRVLVDFIVARGREAVDAGDLDGGHEALGYALSLYRPAELRAPAADPALAGLARSAYLLAARRGQEPLAVLALAVQRSFGPAARTGEIDAAWAQILAWQEGGRRFSRDPEHSGNIESVLEEVSAVMPSPWIVTLLETSYLEQHAQARRLLEDGRAVGPGDRHRLDYTGYKLARLHLRAGDPRAAIASLEKTATDPASAELASLIAETFDKPRSARSGTQLLEYFRPDDPERMPDFAVIQGWSIVEFIAQETLDRFPDDPETHLALADARFFSGYGRAALFHYRRAIAGRSDIHEAWTRVAELEQIELEIVAQEDPSAALTALARIEAFHARAVEQWPDRPVRPGLSEAYASTADGLYHAGRIDDARALLERATRIEPTPRVLELGGLIAFKEGRWSDAKTAYQTLLTLPFEDQYQRVYWEIRARTQLGEIGLRRGESAGAREELQAALGELNLVLSLPGVDPEGRSLWLTERARVFFLVGEPELAMEDFRAAVTATPTRASAYADPLLFCVSHGRYREAAEIFDHAISRGVEGPLSLYFSLWISELAQRTDNTVPAAATRMLRSYRGDPWHEALAAHAVGKITGAELLARASKPGEIAEAHFYEGLRVWRQGEPDAGFAHLRRVLESGMLSFFEYEMASNYLSWRELPRTARSPVHGR